MSTSTYRRVLPLTGRRSGHSLKNKEALTELDERRQRKLYRRYQLMRHLGWKRVLSTLSTDWGFSKGRASQVLNGHEPLTIEWMMIFAYEFDCSPLEIWDADWPFAKLTPPSGNSSVVIALLRSWNDLGSEDQQQILRILKRYQ